MKKILILLIVICINFCALTACNKTDNVNNIVAIEVIGNNKVITINEFDVDDFKLKTIKKDGKHEVIPLTLDMLKAEDIHMLSSRGKHNININYKGLTTVLQVEMVIKKLNLVIYWEDVPKILHLAIIGDTEKNFKSTGFAKFEINLVYESEFEGITARLQGLSTKKKEKEITLFLKSVKNIEVATEIAEVCFSNYIFLPENISIKIYNQAGEELFCQIQYGNDFLMEVA